MVELFVGIIRLTGHPPCLHAASVYRENEPGDCFSARSSLKLGGRRVLPEQRTDNQSWKSLSVYTAPAYIGDEGETSFLLEVRAFRQTAARAPALESPERPIFDKGGAPMADIRDPYTAALNVAHRRGLMVRQFGEKRMNEEKWKGWVGGRAPRGLYGPCRPQDGCERSARSGALPSLHPNKHPTRNSQRVATLILRPSMAHWHALRGNSDARRGQACPPAASGAHCASPRISG